MGARVGGQVLAPPPQAPTAAKPPALPPAPTAAPVQANINYGPPPATGESSDLRASAEQRLGQAKGGWREAVFRAAMNMGDPAILDKLRQDPEFAGFQFATDPNSVYSTLARNETEGLQGIDQASNQNNAFFGGFRLTDRGKLSEDVARQRLGAGTEYQNQLKDFAKALAEAQGLYGEDIRTAGRMESEAAMGHDPQAREPAGVAAGAPAGNPNAARFAYSQSQGAGRANQHRARAKARRRR